MHNRIAQLQATSTNMCSVWFSSVKSLSVCWVLWLLINHEFVCSCSANEHTKNEAFHSEIISIFFGHHRIENLRLRLAYERTFYFGRINVFSWFLYLWHSTQHKVQHSAVKAPAAHFHCCWCCFCCCCCCRIYYYMYIVYIYISSSYQSCGWNMHLYITHECVSFVLIFMRISCLSLSCCRFACMCMCVLVCWCVCFCIHLCELCIVFGSSVTVNHRVHSIREIVVVAFLLCAIDQCHIPNKNVHHVLHCWTGKKEFDVCLSQYGTTTAHHLQWMKLLKFWEIEQILGRKTIKTSTHTHT